MSFTNQSKNTTVLTNETPSPASNLIWNDMTNSWDDTGGSWDNPSTPFANESKNTTVLTNETKN